MPEVQQKHGQGGVGNSNHCDNQCKKWEGAKFGSCHYDSRGRGLFLLLQIVQVLCAKRSKTWSGICISSKNCDKHVGLRKVPATEHVMVASLDGLVTVTSNVK
ncbi:Knottin, scorpion toxin-like superfamily [Sesbania bispinosa]|nr:Knottin, scorpion toxin-like superfamily [Sesbania bispinosa]